MNFIEGDGNIVFSQKARLEETRFFYENLYN